MCGTQAFNQTLNAGLIATRLQGDGTGHELGTPQQVRPYGRIYQSGKKQITVIVNGRPNPKCRPHGAPWDGAQTRHSQAGATLERKFLIPVYDKRHLPLCDTEP
jgi:hypothetical protein